MNWKRTVFAVGALAAGVVVWTGRLRLAEAAQSVTAPEDSFARSVQPFLARNCARCHNADVMTAGVRVDHLTAGMEEEHIKIWEAVRRRIADGSMPPPGQPRPDAAARAAALAWMDRELEMARLRPSPVNGNARRLTVAQYRNTLRELLLIEDDLTEILPPDAVSRDGFLNNRETLQLSPLLVETYFEIAEEALNRAIVNPAEKPVIQNFRMELGANVNPAPFGEPLILGANSHLLENQDFVVSELTPVKPFAFTPYRMRTHYRFIEGYAGNDTVRGWREYNSIYHSVFACMRGSGGYPKGRAYDVVPEGLLLRPAIPNDELFDAEGTYGPKANFKISLRELPDHGRFRVTVMAARYDDGLLLDAGAAAQGASTAAVVVRHPEQRQEVTVAQEGVYQVDIYATPRDLQRPAPDASRLDEGLAGKWSLDKDEGRLEGDARRVESPFGGAVALDGEGDWVEVNRDGRMNVGDGDFTVSAWIRPKQLRKAGIVALGGYNWTHGWYLDMPDGRGAVRLETSGADSALNGVVQSTAGVLRAGEWQHVAAVVRRGGESALYVNGFLVGKGKVGAANLDNPRMNLYLGRIPNANQFQGELDEVRLYRRALAEAEIEALVEPGREFVKPPAEKAPEVTLTLGERQFSGTLNQAAWLVLRLPAGRLTVTARHTGLRPLARMVLTPLAASDEAARRFLAFEKRTPRLGVHLGLRRDCGSTLAQVGEAQAVTDQLSRYVFEGAIRNFPSPDVEKDNVNYLAGIREIGVRSEYTDGRDMPRLLVRSVEFEGPFYDSWPPPSHRAIFVDFPNKDDQRAYGRHIVRRFAERAWRRPITAGEEAALVGVFEKSLAAKTGFEAAVKDALQVVLTSPQFLFLIENSRGPEGEPLDDYELASKLSYFLWNGPPDARMLQLAAAGALRRELDGEVTRLIADRRFERFTSEFASQWLSLDKFQVLEPDRSRFPNLNRHNRTHLRLEPVRFVEYLMRRNLPVRNLVAADFVVANEVVASYYDLGEKVGSGFAFVPVRHERRELGGVLTQAAILAGLSDGRESNPVKRGAWLARKIVAEPPADPPPNVPALPEDTQQLTLRERIERHRSQRGCTQCHATIDPWGIALEEFDAGGRLKAGKVDARSTLPDKTEVAGIDDLRRYLAEERIDQVAFSVLKHLATYATGRTLTYSELHGLKRDALALKPGGYRMQDMIRFVVNSKLFLEK
jgi:mono/diheme cytochrome c family protein